VYKKNPIKKFSFNNICMFYKIINIQKEYLIKKLMLKKMDYRYSLRIDWLIQEVLQHNFQGKYIFSLIIKEVNSFLNKEINYLIR